MSAKSSIPYAGATSSAAARDEIVKLLRKMGCESVGFMDDFERHEVLLAFKHRGRKVQLRASAQGWATLYCKEKPFNPSYHRGHSREYQAKALRQGLIAVNSILR